MRHRRRRTRFGRQNDHRAATLKGLTRSVLIHQRIKTTQVKAKEARRVIEKLITLAKIDNLHHRRMAFSYLGDRALVNKLFKEIAPLFAMRQSGFTRLIPFNFRKGDGASIVFLELTEKKPEEKIKPAKKPTKPEKATKVKETPPKEKPKAAPEFQPEIKEEKAVEEVKKERAKDEDKKMIKQKGFLKKVKGFFRRKTNM